MMGEGYKSDVLDAIRELQEDIASGGLLHDEPHSISDFERVRFRSYECKECGHHIGKQQLVALYHLERMQQVIDTEGRPRLTEYNDEISMIHPTD